MDSILNFLADNYLIFIIVSGVLLLALIGFIVSGRKKKKGEVQTADPVAQPMQAPTPTDVNQMPTPVDTTVAPVEPVAPVAPANQELTPEQQALMGNQAAAPVEPQPVAAPVEQPAMEPVASDEPTLVINDPSATTTSEPAANMFDPSAALVEAPVQSEPVVAAPVVDSTPVSEPAPVAQDVVTPVEPQAPVAPVEPIQPATSLFETPVAQPQDNTTNNQPM